MTISPAFRGHGTFCYIPDETMNRYRDYGDPPPAGSEVSDRAARFAQALTDMGMSHAWVRLFGLEGAMDPRTTREMIEGLRAAGIHVAGWGYCHGRDARREADQAVTEARRYGLTSFIADIEPGRLLGGTKSRWGLDEFSGFIDKLADAFGSDNLGVSTWPVLRIQNDPAFPSKALMAKVADRVAMFAPQAYWMSYPKDVHYNATGFDEDDYPRDDPASFVRLVVDSWRADGFTQPLVVTGQAYWGEGAPSPAVLDDKIAEFGAKFPDWGKITGFNWWHAGGPKAMSPDMIATLKAAGLGSKAYASPDAVA